MYKKNPKMLNQFQYCERESVPFIVTVGEGEKAKGGVTLRNTVTREEVRKMYITLVYYNQILFSVSRNS